MPNEAVLKEISNASFDAKKQHEPIEIFFIEVK